MLEKSVDIQLIAEVTKLSQEEISYEQKKKNYLNEYKGEIMRLKTINMAIILACGLNFPLAISAETTQSSTKDMASKGTDLSQPNMPDSEVLSWANSTAVATFTFNNTNYRDEIQKLSGSFTDSGWTKFLEALKNSKNLDAVKSKQLTVSAIVTSAPIILQKGVLNNVYSWKVQVPMTISYKGPNDNTQQNVIVTMLINRTSSANTPAGVGVAQYQIGPANNN